jgi:hypothetical protein
MSSATIIGAHGRAMASELRGEIARLRGQAPGSAARPVAGILATLDRYALALLTSDSTRQLEGVAFLSAWCKRGNLDKMLTLALGESARLDDFQPFGRDFIAARPRGLVSMWMAGNVPTLPLFSIVPGLLTKNVLLVKLADDNLDGMQALLRVLSEQPGEPSGAELCEGLSVVAFDHRQHTLAEEMSIAADTKVVWGGSEAVRAVRGLAQRPHCTNVAFGPKYSIGAISRDRLEAGDLPPLIAAFVRDIVAFDQRACSSPQTIFVERSPTVSLADVGRAFAEAFAQLPPKPESDAFTTVQILNARAAWSLDPTRDVIASQDGANWTVCMDGELALKEAVQSRTLFLTEVDDLDRVTPLLHSGVQTVGIAFSDVDRARRFSSRACDAGAVRCVRPGLMNVHESPWDGRMLAADLVRWVTFKP